MFVLVFLWISASQTEGKFFYLRQGAALFFDFLFNYLRHPSAPFYRLSFQLRVLLMVQLREPSVKTQ
jgi:hypothetical protein